MMSYRIFLEEERRKLSETKELLLEELGDRTIRSEKEILEELDEITIKLAVIKKEFEKLGYNDVK